MRRVQFTFSCGTQLTYELNNTKTATLWCEKLAKMHRRFLLRTDVNHRHGFASELEIQAAVARLEKSAKFLGFPLEPLTRRNWQGELNRLHVNFPEFFKSKFDRESFQAAHETNLLIHWLEYELMNLLGKKDQYLFNLDFNHFPAAYNLKENIPEGEFGNFEPALQFGNLHLHYINIGRHFLEMFDANDMDSPPHHFKAQHEFNATCGLVFSEASDPMRLDLDMRAYYDRRGGKEFFGFEYEDPKLAKGFFKIGQLADLTSYSSFESRQALREQLRSSRIAAWRLWYGSSAGGWLASRVCRG